MARASTVKYGARSRVSVLMVSLSTSCALTGLARSADGGVFGGLGAMAKTPESARSRVSGGEHGALGLSGGSAVCGLGAGERLTRRAMTMAYGRSPSSTAPLPPTGMATELAVGGWRLAVGAFGGGASTAFFADLPNGDAATGFTTAFGASTNGGAFGCGTRVAAAA